MHSYIKSRQINIINSDTLIRLLFFVLLSLMIRYQYKEDALLQINNMLTRHEIPNVPTLHQLPTLPTGCEAVSATMLLQWKGLDITMEEVANDLPKGKRPFVLGGKLVGGNPYIEFVGDPFSSSGYGVYHTPIYNLLNKYCPNEVDDMTGCSFENLLTIIDSGQPVMVWATIDMRKPKIRSTWYDIKGNLITWKTPEHALVLIGYSDNEVIVNDPLQGKKVYYDQSDFIINWKFMGSQAITIHR